MDFDRFIDLMNENGVVINYILTFWDKVGHAAGEELPRRRFTTEEDIRRFLNYARLIVSHFKGRVQYYTIWSEPEAGVKAIRPFDYVNLTRRLIPVIREEDPQAKVVTGPVVLYFGRSHLYTLLQSDVIQLFDVISTHPMYDTAPDIDFIGHEDSEYPLPWPGHTRQQNLKYVTRAVVMHLGLDAGVGVYEPPPYLYAILAGTVPADLRLEIESEATNIVSYGFTDPNGDMLLALWTDGAAVDYDPGVTATLTFPGVTVSRVTGINLLEQAGFEQELNIETGAGDLVIRDLLVRDYPIFVRLTD